MHAPRLLLLRGALAGILGALLLLAGCRDQPEAPDYVARVGGQYFRASDLSDALDALPPGTDSAAASRQVIQQWVARTLLYREAQRRRLQDEGAVKKRLEESRRSVLVSALVDQLYDEQPDRPSPEDVRAYFEQHRDALRLREPYVRVRYLRAERRATADSARAALQQATASGAAGSLWPGIARRFAADTARALRLARRYRPESSLFASRPSLKTALENLDDRQLAPVTEAGGRFHVLQLAERVPADTLPKLEWVEEEVRQRLLLQQRKQMYARQVERLRSQARSSGALDVP